MSRKRELLGTVAALLGAAGAVPASPAQLPPAAIVHQLRPRQVITQMPVGSTPTAKPEAYKRIVDEKRAAKHAMDAARRRREKISWRTARERGLFWIYLMRFHGTREDWQDQRNEMRRAL